MASRNLLIESKVHPPTRTAVAVASFKRDPRMGAKNFDYVRNPDVPLLVPEAAARRAGSSSRLAGPTRHLMGSQD